MANDLVCGMDVDKDTARHKTTHKGKTGRYRNLSRFHALFFSLFPIALSTHFTTENIFLAVNNFAIGCKLT